MGLVNAEIELSNPRDGEIRPVKTKALVDTGALHLCIPEHIALQLKLEELYKREVKTADGKGHLVPYMGKAPTSPLPWRSSQTGLHSRSEPSARRSVMVLRCKSRHDVHDLNVGRHGPEAKHDREEGVVGMRFRDAGG